MAAAIPSVMSELMMTIGGEPTAPENGDRYDVYDAARGERIAQAPSAGAADIDRAVAAGLAAADGWRRMGPVERARRVIAFAGKVRDIAEDLAQLDTRNSGNPIVGTRYGALKGAETLSYFAGLAMELTGRTIPASTDHLHYTVREPIGVVGIITAYNHPTLFATARTAPALVAGNTVILKPAVQTPLSALFLGEIAQGFFPPGVFNVVSGGVEAGRALVRHPEVRRIGFTGSVGTALQIQADAAASGSIKRLGFELGGKNPIVVLPDVSLERAIDGAVEGMNLQKVLGQSCGSTSRAFVHRDLYADFVDGMAARFAGLRMGWPEDADTQLGSLVSEAQREKVERYVQIGKGEGATLVTGGGRPQAPFDRGYYYLPTIFADGRADMRIAREEIFGPVLTIIPWDDEAEMLRGVNSVDYGLTASIFTDDLRTAHRLASEIQVGYVWINDVEKRWIGVPFGGFKNSGTSSEFCIDELFANTQLKSVSVSLV